MNTALHRSAGVRTALMVCACGMALVTPRIARAAPIHYVLTGTGSGTFAGQTFTDAAITENLFGDTATVTQPFAGVYFDLGTANVTVAGIGTGTFTDQMEALSNQNSPPGPLGGLSDQTSDLGMSGVFNSAFATYDLKSAFGPASSATASLSHLVDFPTTIGNFNQSALSDVTFTATIVPEPSVVLIVAAGAFLRRHRQREA